MEKFFTSIGMPLRLREFDIEKDCVEKLAELCTFGKTRSIKTYVDFDFDKTRELFELCY